MDNNKNNEMTAIKQTSSQSSPIIHLNQHKTGKIQHKLVVLDMYEDENTVESPHERQSQQSHLELSQNFAQGHKHNLLPVIDEATNNHTHTLHHPNKAVQSSNENQCGPHFERSIQPNKSPFIKLQPKRLMQGNGPHKSGTNIKKHQVLCKTRTIIEGENVNSLSKTTLKQNNYLRKNMKNKNSYDQLMDKNLIQYLYTRQNKIFEQEQPIKTHYPEKKAQTHQSREMVRKSPTYQLASRLKLIKRESKPFEIKTDWRGTKVNIFDAISCEQSRKLNDKYSSYKSVRGSEEVHPDRDNKPELQVLKNRMTKLEETVYHKIPFLVEMGVKFKCRK